ncbi:MAG: SIR2 family protein [Methanosarcinaceae archaeon]
MKNQNDDDIKIAFSLHSSPGIYALLLGSGISRNAGIPTGWEVVFDLIKKVAYTEGEFSLSDPEKWYKDRYGEDPDYSKLLDKLTTTSAERAKMLYQYFEPTEEELEDGLKTPTIAHKAIAKLVKYGYIRVILTTNFDRLLEKALGEEEVTPVVISTDDSLEGAMPYVHNRCTIIKLHGDYMDTRIKNTPEELAHYSEILNDYLDRIFDDFGLIVCGWSAEWDKALRDSLFRRKNRRFSTYWTSKGQVGDEAVKLISHLKAQQVTIDGADEFFSKLSDNVGALRDFERPHPLSTTLAVAKVKKYLVEDKYSIKLHDLVMEELDRVCFELASDRFEINVELTSDLYLNRVYEYEELMKTLIGISTTIVYFDKGKHSILINKIIERIVKLPRTFGDRDLSRLQSYPALLLLNSIGVVSLESYNYDVLATILLKTHYKGYWFSNSGKKTNLIKELYKFQILQPQKNTKIAKPENYIVEAVRKYVDEYLPDDKKYEEYFDIFEYLLGLVCIDLQYSDLSKEDIYAPRDRLGWKFYNDFHSDEKPDFIHDFIKEGLSEANEWGLLKAGFFEGSSERLKDCYQAYEEFLKKEYKKNTRWIN